MSDGGRVNESPTCTKKGPPKSYFICDLKLRQNFITLGHPILGEKYVNPERRKKNNPQNSGHVSLQRPMTVHALRSDQ